MATTAAAAATTTLSNSSNNNNSNTNKRLSKRFSFGGFSLFNKSSSSSNQATTAPKPDARRAQKTQSLYIRHLKDAVKTTQYDPSEAEQTNGQEIRNSIRRSLSAVLYASPQQPSSSGLVPVLVTQDLSDRTGGIIVPESSQSDEKKENKKRPVEYDNTLDIMIDPKSDEIMIVWQGYGFVYPTTAGDKEAVKEDLHTRFEKQIWSSYQGLIHPLHLFENETEERWAALTVHELKRYFDNYGSMLLKLREASMRRQQRQYLVMEKAQVNNEWIIPQVDET